MKLQVPSEYEKMRMEAIEALIYQGIRVPTDRQIAVYILTGEVVDND